ncbi:hypothetical protein FOL47_007441 [Perkinsus chesapeaki]|uniref:Uncharacterized protein n=1 Tax=Perkinsus chesapeaki TaxID=330153 RepID=A0A7J6MVL9_PERCH|nr:hypothetical protein FOL47_007441 [Perkinsus chesapeaki]
MNERSAPRSLEVRGELEISTPDTSSLWYPNNVEDGVVCATPQRARRCIYLGQSQAYKIRSDRPVLSMLAPRVRDRRDLRKLASTKSSAAWDRTHIALYDSAQLILVDTSNGDQRTLCIGEKESIRSVAGGRGIYSLVGVQDKDTLERSILVLDSRTGNLLAKVNKDASNFIGTIEGDSFIRVFNSFRSDSCMVTKYRVFF